MQRLKQDLDGIRVRYIYSACVVIESSDVSVLCDPWFTEGIYDGAWYHFPRVDDPLRTIGNVDYVFISHIHPDHYDPQFLHAYEDQYGPKTILVASRQFPYLRDALLREGFEVLEVTDKLTYGSTTIRAIPIRPNDRNEIDSALCVTRIESNGREHSVLNVNDIIFDAVTLQELSAQCPEPDILLLGYTGAGPYPQTYFDLSDPNLLIKAEQKKADFFRRYLQNTRAFKAHINIPFAGKYLLGGSLAKLNPYRGVADPIEILEIDARAVVLADQIGSISTLDLVPSAIRTHAYSPAFVKQRIDEIAENKMTYELIDTKFVDLIPFERLFRKAYSRAKSLSAMTSDYFFVFDIPQSKKIVLNANRGAAEGFSLVDSNGELPEPRSEIWVDQRYLFGLLTGVFHWNTAEIGSQYFVRRSPDVFVREAQQFLNFLSI